MDIASLNKQVEAEEEPVELPIYQKGGDPILGVDGEQATISVVGSDSKRVRAEERANTRRQIRGSRREITPEQLHDNRIRLAASAVVGWSGFEDSKGKPWPCEPDNVRTLLSVPFILRQVEEGVGTHSGFSETCSES